MAADRREPRDGSADEPSREVSSWPGCPAGCDGFPTLVSSDPAWPVLVRGYMGAIHLVHLLSLWFWVKW